MSTPPAVAALTEPQQRCLDAIVAHIAANGYGPTVRELKATLGYGSNSSVIHHLRRLEAAGSIVRERNLSRTIRLTPHTPDCEVPQRD